MIASTKKTPLQSQHNERVAARKSALYKTELCRSYEETGTCRYGSKCQFAHDVTELRSVARHPRYKTEICRTYWELGSCPYGKRCCFIHLENVSDPSPAPVNDKVMRRRSLPTLSLLTDSPVPRRSFESPELASPPGAEYCSTPFDILRPSISPLLADVNSLTPTPLPEQHLRPHEAQSSLSASIRASPVKLTAPRSNPLLSTSLPNINEVPAPHKMMLPSTPCQQRKATHHRKYSCDLANWPNPSTLDALRTDWDIDLPEMLSGRSPLQSPIPRTLIQKAPGQPLDLDGCATQDLQMMVDQLGI